MKESLSELQNKVSSVIYNPFVNLKDQVKSIKTLLADKEQFAGQVLGFELALKDLDLYEDLPYDNMERAKGFNKTKTHILKLLKEVAELQA